MTPFEVAQRTARFLSRKVDHMGVNIELLKCECSGLRTSIACLESDNATRGKVQAVLEDERLAQQILNLRLEEDIAVQKRRVACLEDDIVLQTRRVSCLEEEIAEQKRENADQKLMNVRLERKIDDFDVTIRAMKAAFCLC